MIGLVTVLVEAKKIPSSRGDLKYLCYSSMNK